MRHRLFSLYLLTFAFLTLLIIQTVGQASPPPAPAPPAPPPDLADIQPINPKIGVHTRLTDEPDPQKIDATLRLVREMGASWVVEYFPWSYIQPTDANHYDWQHADRVVNAATAYSLTLIARIDGVPAWARPEHPDPQMWRYLAAEHYGQYATFVATFVARYKGRVQHYIIWNEQNTAAEWGERPPDPAAYAALMQQVYPAAKAADPAAIIMFGGLAPNLEPPGSTVAMSDLAYLDAYYKAGGGAYFDALAAHVYPLSVPPAPPADPAAPDKLNFARAAQLRNIMLAHGDAAKPIYITEGGWNDNRRFTYAVRPAQRIEYTISAYKAAQSWDWCASVSLWAFSLPAPTYTYMDNYTFLAPDLVPKPIYLEVQKYALGRLCYNTPMFEQIAWLILLLTALVVLGLRWFFRSPNALRRADRLARSLLLTVAGISAIVIVLVCGYLGAVLGGLPGFILAGLFGLACAVAIVMFFFAHADLS